MTKKEVLELLEKKEKIISFDSLEEMLNYLTIYCFEDITDPKQFLETEKDYYIHYDKKWYSCLYDGIAPYVNNNLFKKYDLLDLYCDCWTYDTDNLENITINCTIHTKIYTNSFLEEYVFFNGKKLYLKDITEF